jgi:hypothetical protein
MTRAWPDVAQAKKRATTHFGKLLLENRPKIFLSASFDNYYHFLLESLPKFIEAVKRVPDMLVLVPMSRPDFVDEFLKESGADFLEIEDGTWNVSGLFLVERKPYSPLVKSEISLLMKEFLGSERPPGESKNYAYMSPGWVLAGLLILRRG